MSVARGIASYHTKRGTSFQCSRPLSAKLSRSHALFLEEVDYRVGVADIEPHGSIPAGDIRGV